jgi:hypothetical protein
MKRRLLRFVGLAVPVCSVLFAGLYVFRGPLFAPLLIARAKERVAETYGAELSVDALGGSWFGDVTVEGIRWDCAEPPLLHLEASRVRVDFSLFGLLRGDPGALRAITATVERAELAASEASAAGPTEPPTSLPPLDLAVTELSYRLDDVRALSARDTHVRVRHRDARVRVTVARGADAITVRAAAVTWRDAARELTESVSARGSYDGGQIAIDEANFGDVLRASGLQTSLKAGGWQAMLSEAAGHVELRWRGDPELAIDMEFAEGRAALRGDLRTAGGELSVQRGDLVFGTDLARLFEDAEVDVLLDADFEDVGPLGALFGLDWRGSLKGGVDVEGPLTAPTGVLTAIGEGIRLGEVELGRAELDVRADGKRVDIVRCDFDTDPWSGSLSGSWIPEQRAFESVSVELRGGGEQLVRGFAPDSFELALAAAGPLGQLTGQFEATGAGVRLGPFGAANLVAKGEFEGRSVAVEELVLRQDARTLMLGGRGGVRDGSPFLELDHLLLEGGDGTLQLEAPSQLALRDGVLHMDQLSLSSDVDGRTGYLEGRTEGVTVDLRLDNFNPRPLIALASTSGWSIGGLDGTVAGNIDPAAADLLFDLSVHGLVPRPGGPSYEFSVRGALAPEGALDAVVEGHSDEVRRFRLDLRAPYDAARPGELFGPGEVRLGIEADELRLELLDQVLGTSTRASGRGRVAAELVGSWGNLSGTLTAAASELRTPESDAALGEPVEVEIEAELGELVVLRRTSIRAGERDLAQVSGVVHTPFVLRDWIADPALLARAELELEAEFELPIAGWTQRAPEVRRLDGRLCGKTSVTGTALEPNLAGHLQLREGELRLASAFPAVRAMNADIDLDGRTVTIRELTAEIGAAPCVVTGQLEWAENGLEVDLSLSGQNVLLARTSHLKVRADARLSLRGPVSDLLAEGSVLVTEGRFVRDIDVLSSLTPDGRSSARQVAWQPSFWSEPPLANMRLDVHLTAAEDLELRGNLYRVTARPDLFLRGTGQVPVFEGRLYIGESSVSLPSGRATIAAGVLQFSSDRPYAPELSLSAETRSRGYDITAQVSGTIDAPEILLSSVPALPNDELLVLFLTGQLPAQSGNNLGAAESVGVYLAQDYVTRLLFGGSVESEESLLDRLVFEVGADVSRSGAPTARGIYFLAPHRTRTGSTTYLLAEQDKYDKTNFGFGLRFRFR